MSTLFDPVLEKAFNEMPEVFTSTDYTRSIRRLGGEDRLIANGHHLKFLKANPSRVKQDDKRIKLWHKVSGLYSDSKNALNKSVPPSTKELISNDEVMSGMDIMIPERSAKILSMRLETAKLYLCDLYSEDKPQIFEAIGRAKHMMEQVIHDLRKL
jgi:hypothetical protein